MKQTLKKEDYPSYNEIKNMSDTELLNTFKPNVFTEKPNFGQKSEQDSEIERFVKFLQEKNEWTFSEEEKDKLNLYWLASKFKSPFNDQRMGSMEEGKVDESKPIDTWFKKNSDDTYTCTGTFVWALLVTYNGPYYEDYEKLGYIDRGHSKEIAETLTNG